MTDPVQISFLHCSNQKCKWKVRYKGEWRAQPDFCPKCGWLAVYHCPNCAPSFALRGRLTKPEPSLFENGECRLCRAQSKEYMLIFLRRLREELASASGFVAKDQMTYKKELDTSPDSFPFRMQEKFYSGDEHKGRVLKYYREDSDLDLEQVTLFLRTKLDRLDNQEGSETNV